MKPIEYLQYGFFVFLSCPLWVSICFCFTVSFFFFVIVKLDFLIFFLYFFSHFVLCLNGLIRVREDLQSSWFVCKSPIVSFNLFSLLNKAIMYCRIPPIDKWNKYQSFCYVSRWLNTFAVRIYIGISLVFACLIVFYRHFLFLSCWQLVEIESILIYGAILSKLATSHPNTCSGSKSGTADVIN